jgi:hypothetical protein
MFLLIKEEWVYGSQKDYKHYIKSKFYDRLAYSYSVQVNQKLFWAALKELWYQGIFLLAYSSDKSDSPDMWADTFFILTYKIC